MTTTPSLKRFPIHLGREGRAAAQPEFTGMEWYDAYVERTAEDGSEGRLVSMYSFEESWTSWERHPEGDEVVVCTAGTLTLIQELAGGTSNSVTLREGEYAINPRGVWHTMDVEKPGTALFITTGAGTEHRER